MDYARDYRQKVLQPDNEKKLHALRKIIVRKIFDVGYDSTLVKVITSLDTWLEWQDKRSDKYYYDGLEHDQYLARILENLILCDENGDREFLSLIHTIVEIHVRKMKGAGNEQKRSIVEADGEASQ